jgi:hypothetical protein
MTLPRPPILVSPQGQGVFLKNVQLSWRDPGIANYNQATQWHVTLSPGGFVSDVASPSTNVTVSGPLLFRTKYTWTVQASNKFGTSKVSSAGFTTIDPPSPKNLSPSNRAGFIAVVLSWVDPGAEMGLPALEYQIQLSGPLPTGEGPSPVQFVCQTTNFNVPIVLLPSSVYTWQVSSQYPPLNSILSLSNPTSAQFMTLSA